MVELVSERLNRGALKEYLRYLKEIHTGKLVTVTSAHELSSEEKHKIERELVGKKVSYVVDPSLLVGVKISGSDFSYEFNLNNRLEKALDYLNVS